MKYIDIINFIISMKSCYLIGDVKSKLFLGQFWQMLMSTKVNNHDINHIAKNTSYLIYEYIKNVTDMLGLELEPHPAQHAPCIVNSKQ